MTGAQDSGEAKFVTRDECFACGSKDLEELSSGRFDEAPLREHILADPWGEDPLLHLASEAWAFVRCKGCGQAFHAKILSPVWQETLYTRWVTEDAIREFEAKHEVDSAAAIFEAARESVRHLLRLDRMTRVLRSDGERLRLLDFGCGWGRFLAIASLFGAESFGIDKDPDRRKGAAEDTGVRVESSLEKLDPSLKGNLHGITLFQVLEHLDEPRPIVEELHDWIMPGGILILETPNCHGITGLDDPQDYRDINPLAHINAFTPETLRHFGERLGFKAVAPVAAHATAEPVAAAKTEARRVLSTLPGLIRSTTNQYFRRL